MQKNLYILKSYIKTESPKKNSTAQHLRRKFGVWGVWTSLHPFPSPPSQQQNLWSIIYTQTNLHSCVFEATPDDFSLNLYKIDRDLKFLCFLPVCSHTCLLHIHRCTCMYAHAWGSPPTPPTPQKIWRPKSYWKPRYGTLCHWMQNFNLTFWTYKIFLSKFEGGGGGGVSGNQTPPTTTPKLQLDFKSKKSSCSLGVVGGGVSGTRPPPHHHP